MRKGRGITGLLIAAGLVTLGVAAFARKQNRGGRVGGRISSAKTLWLNYTLVSWFVVPIALLCRGGLSPASKRALGAHLASFGARGAAEMWMLYRTHSWRVAYGVGHDLFDLALISVLMRDGPPVSSADEVARGHLNAIRGTLVAEMAFATLFHRAVKGLTQGQDAIYFASDEAEFRRINRLTAAVNTAAYAHLVRTGARLAFDGAASLRSE